MNNYISILSDMINCRTVYHDDHRNQAEYDRFYAILEKHFPLIHQHASKLIFGNGCFFYHIKGKNPQKRILYMSHHDVVKETPGWNSDAFVATIKDGALYGRGTIDTKTPLFAQLEATEELLSEGFDFEGYDFYIGSSHNEEVGGDGMVLAVEYFKKKGFTLMLF